MGSGSKGPAVMLIRGQAQYRNSYLIAMANGNLLAAVDAVVGMASILPTEANYPIPEPPRVIFEKEVIEWTEKRKIQTWLITEKAKVEKAISSYVYGFYKQGGESRDL